VVQVVLQIKVLGVVAVAVLVDLEKINLQLLLTQLLL
tara:strand:+ start:151 stop:261 length:111 start_codon:yes stop_codon:yes gene_type:complete